MAATSTAGPATTPHELPAASGRAHWARLAAVGLLLAAWTLRLYRSGRQSLSADEIATLQAAHAPDLGAFLQTHAGLDHPPLYFLFERLWTAAAGTSETALRLPSALASVLCLALVYQLARRLGGSGLALAVLAMGSMSPFWVFFGQEARGYAFMLLGCTFGLWLAVRIGQGASGWWWWAAWSATAAATTLTMYVAAPALAAQGAYLTWVAWRRRAWRPWLLGACLGATLVAAWALYANPLERLYDTRNELTPRTDTLQALARGAGALVSGNFLPEPWPWLTALPLAALALLGWRALPASRGWLLAGAVALPWLAVLLAAGDRLGFHPRYLLAATPAVYLLAAAGLVGLATRQRVLALAAAGLLLVPAAWGLRNAYSEPLYSRSDFRGAATYLAARFREGDVVVYNAPWAKSPFEYYAGTSFASVGLPHDTPPGPADTQALEELRNRYQRIWLVRWQDWFTDPSQALRAWLDTNTTKIAEQPFPYVTVEGYLSRSPIEPVRGTPPPSVADFGGRVRLVDWQVRLAPRPGAAARVSVRLRWLSRGPTDRRYKVFAHLVPAPGRPAVAQYDAEPVYGRLATTAWPPDAVISDSFDIDVPAAAGPGPFDLILGLYTEDGARVPVLETGQDHAVLARGLRFAAPD